MKHGKKLFRTLVYFAPIILLASFFLPGMTALPVSASIDAGNQITSDTTFALVHSSHINPLNVQEAPSAANVTDVLAPDEIMSPISTSSGYSDCLMSSPLPENEAQSLSQSPGPGPDDQSEYMIGDVAVTVIFPESDGAIDPNKETWSSSRMKTCLDKIRAGLDWWEAQYSGKGVSLRFDVYAYYDDYDNPISKPTSYEPITRPSEDEGLWIDEILTELGYTSGSYKQKVKDLNNHMRELHNDDWAFTIFVVDSLNDADGKFTDDYFAYSYTGGPFVVMTYDNDGYGIESMDCVTAHETGHIFYATDEYDDKWEYSGYLDIQDHDNVACIMSGGVKWYLCSETKGQIGWRDSDGDGILDPVDTVPDTVLNPYSPDPTYENVLIYNGTAQDVPLTNLNPNGPGNDVTINTITMVQYRIDNGTWYNATSADGSFDEVTEAFTFTTPPLLPGTHVIQTRAQNSVGNWETSYAVDSITIQVDTIKPTVMLNNVPDFVKSLTSISGTAADTAPGQVDKVRIQIKNTTNNTYWSGSSWIATGTWLNATGTTSWSYSMPLLTNGKSYQVEVKSIDKAGNESPIASDSFIFDTSSPTVKINDIPDFVKLLTSISGTAADTEPGQIDKVQVRIKNTTNNTYWSGSSWIATGTWLNATGTTSWSYSMPLLTNGKSYQVEAKSIDKAGNESPIASDSFTFDTSSPTVKLNDIPDFVKLLTSISGTAADTEPGQIDKVQVRIKNTTNNTYWSGSSWIVTGTWLNATGTTPWSYPMPLLTNGKSYQVEVKSIDKAVNESPIASDSFTFDTTNPTVTLDNIPDFVKSLPSISGAMADTAPGQVDKVQVRIKNTADNTYWSGSSWIATGTWLNATGTTPWSYPMPLLTNGKSYQVEVKSIDKAVNESPIASDSFIFDATNPTVTLDNIPDSIRSLTLINGTASDTSPGQLDKIQVQLKNTSDSTYWNGSSWVTAETWLDATGTTSWSCNMPLLTNGKSYQVKVKSLDKGGNESTLASDNFTCHIPLPIWVWVIVGIAGVLCIGIVLIILRHRLAE